MNCGKPVLVEEGLCSLLSYRVSYATGEGIQVEMFL